MPNETFPIEMVSVCVGPAGPAPPIDRSSATPSSVVADTIAAQQLERLDQRRGEVVEDAIERFARQELRREVAEQPGITLALGRALPFIDHPRDQQPDDRAHHQEHDSRDGVLHARDPEARTSGAVKKNVKPSEQSTGGDHACPDPAGRRREHDRQEIEGHADHVALAVDQQTQSRGHASTAPAR